MANFTIHLAIAKEFLKKHPEYDKEQFLEGVIAPDLVEDKSITHFSKNSDDCDLGKFLSKYKLDKAYYSGWYLHLITDILFYKDYLNDWDSRADKNRTLLYNDYDIINKIIIEKYKLVLPDEIKHISKDKDGKLIYINEDTIFKFIERVSEIDIETYYKN